MTNVRRVFSNLVFAPSGLHFFILMVLGFTFTGCVKFPAKSSIAKPYLDSTHVIKLDKAPYTFVEQRVQNGDYVDVRFAGLNPNVSMTLNNYGGAVISSEGADAVSSTGFNGQQVDKQGYLNFPLIGKVKATGLTMEELRAELLKKVEPILAQPYIYISLPKRGVMVFGEAGLSVPIVLAKEKMSILEILALAGKYDEFTDLSRVKVYRELDNGDRLLGNLNLYDTSFFKSEFFYPKPNDIVYIPAVEEKSKVKERAANLQVITIFTSVISVILANLINNLLFK